MEYFMVPFMVLFSIFSIYGTLYNLKTKNMPGALIGGSFTAALVVITLLSLYDFFLGIDTLLPYVPW